MHILGDLRHVAAVGRLVEDDVDAIERGGDVGAFAHVALHELRVLIHPGGFAELVRVRLEVIENADAPAFAHEQIGQMRSDQARAAGDQRAFSVFVVGVHDGSDKCARGLRAR